jgi:tRNA threonylcarbamoyl adenosine modification protein (Sua5/YciO/YrdC/YwlC family)
MQVPLSICVGHVDQVAHCGSCQNLPEGLLHALLPGPVTLVLSRLPDAPLSRFLNPGLTGVAIRVPENEFVRDVLAGFTTPLVLTSANKSGEPSATRIEQFSELWDRVDWVFDGGEIACDNKGSTIVDLQRCVDGTYKILRDGCALEATTEILASFGLRRDVS